MLLMCLQFSVVTFDMFAFIPRGVVGYHVSPCCLHAYIFLL